MNRFGLRYANGIQTRGGKERERERGEEEGLNDANKSEPRNLSTTEPNDVGG